MVQTVSVYEVEDFDAWNRVWEANIPVHRQHGVRRHELHFTPNSRTRFVVAREFDDLAQARAYLASPERQRRMQSAGVVRCEDFLPEAPVSS